MNQLTELAWCWRFLIFSGVILWIIILIWIYWIIEIKISDWKDNRKRDHDMENLKRINKNILHE